MDATGQRGHALTPQLGTATEVRTGMTTDLLHPAHYPVEAFCLECGGLIRSEDYFSGWVHIDRGPGDPLEDR